MKQDSMTQVTEKLKNVESGNIGQYDDWYRIFRLALQGMNYGEGDFHNTGERNIMRLIKEKMTGKKAVIFDVGANIGEYTNRLIEVFSDADFEIHAFEPSKVTFETLNDNVKDKRVVLNGIGLSCEKKEAVLYSNHDCSGLASLYDRQLDYYGIELTQQEKVSLNTLDNYCSENQIEKIDFLKMDVEGNEINVLRGGGGIMLHEKKIQALQFEFGGCNIDSRTYFRDFWNMLHDDYDLFKICKDGLHKIERYTEKLEIFDCCNYFANLK